MASEEHGVISPDFIANFNPSKISSYIKFDGKLPTSLCLIDLLKKDVRLSAALRRLDTNNLLKKKEKKQSNIDVNIRINNAVDEIQTKQLNDEEYMQLVKAQSRLIVQTDFDGLKDLLTDDEDINEDIEISELLEETLKLTLSNREQVRNVEKRIHLMNGIKKHKTASIKMMNDKVLTRSRVRCNWSCGYYIVSGEVDGLDDDKQVIIELKHSTNLKLTKQYKLQCLFYMKMTGYKECHLINLKPNGEHELKEVIKYDHKEFTDAHETLCNLVERIRNYTTNDLKCILEEINKKSRQEVLL